MTLKQTAIEIYQTSMQLVQGTPRTEYRRMKVAELPRDDQTIVRGYLEGMRPPGYRGVFNRRVSYENNQRQATRHSRMD